MHTMPQHEGVGLLNDTNCGFMSEPPALIFNSPFFSFSSDVDLPNACHSSTHSSNHRDIKDSLQLTCSGTGERFPAGACSLEQRSVPLLFRAKIVPNKVFLCTCLHFSYSFSSCN